MYKKKNFRFYIEIRKKKQRLFTPMQTLKNSIIELIFQ